MLLLRDYDPCHIQLWSDAIFSLRHLLLMSASDAFVKHLCMTYMRNVCVWHLNEISVCDICLQCLIVQHDCEFFLMTFPRILLLADEPRPFHLEDWSSFRTARHYRWSMSHQHPILLPTFRLPILSQDILIGWVGAITPMPGVDWQEVGWGYVNHTNARGLLTGLCESYQYQGWIDWGRGSMW